MVNDSDANFEGWSGDRGVTELLANMLWCLLEEWAEMLGHFKLDGKKEILLARLVRSHPELGYEALPPGYEERIKGPPEPHDPPPRTRVLTTCRCIQVKLATEEWTKNPSDGGVYVGNGRGIWPRSNFWADGKVKVARQVGRRILCGQALYVGSDDETWNAEELIDMWSLQDCSGAAAPRSQSAGLRELRILAEQELSVCGMGLVLKHSILERPSSLGGFAQGLPSAALEILQAEKPSLLPMSLPGVEVEVMATLRGSRDGEPIPDQVARKPRGKILVVGQLCWEWLVVLMLNWGARARVGHPAVWSPGQKDVAQRVVRCVAWKRSPGKSVRFVEARVSAGCRSRRHTH